MQYVSDEYEYEHHGVEYYPSESDVSTRCTSSRCNGRTDKRTDARNLTNKLREN